MARRRNGAAVILTENGVEVVPAYVRRIANVHFDGNKISPYLAKDARYILIGGSRVIEEDIEFSSKPMPEVIERAVKYGKTKFFRLIVDLMKLAQFDPFLERVSAFNSMPFNRLKNPSEPIDSDINFDLSVAEIDAQLFKKYNFTAEMVEFVEGRYSYDDGREPVNREGGQIC